jgi:hypothetical protein
MLTWIKNADPNGDNVVVSNLTNVNFFCFEKFVKIEFKNEGHKFIFSNKYHDCPKAKILHIIHLTNQH